MSSTNQQQVSITVTSFLPEYKAVIALNNMGVTLLRRRCYNDALQSFQNAFTLMNTTLKDSISIKSVDQVNHNDESKNMKVVAQDMLYQTSMKLAKSSIIKVSQSDEEQHSNLLEPTIITADTTSKSLLDLLQLTPSNDNCYILRIDDDCVCDYDDIVPVNDYLMEISIILNNIGTVYRCYARDMKSSSSSSSSLPLRAKSLTKMMKKMKKVITSGLSFCIAAQRIISTIDDTNFNEDEMKRQGLFSLLILNNLMNLSADIGDVENSRQYYIEYGDLRSLLLTNLFIEESEDNNNFDNVNCDHNVGYCFHVKNELFHDLTAARAA